MRTILRLGTGMAITVLVAGAAESCALPAYVSSGGSSSGGGGAASGSGGAGATTSSSSGARDGGKDGDLGASSGSSGMSSGSGMNADDGGDGGPGCIKPWGHCPVGTNAGDGCSCPLQACYLGMCDPVMGTGSVTELVCIPGPTNTWKSQPFMTPERCCPGIQEPCKGNELCVVTTPQNQPDMPECVPIPQACMGLKADMLCNDALCKKALCPDLKAMQCGMMGMGPGHITCTF